MKRKLKEKKIVHKTSACSGAAEPEAGPEIEVLKPALKKQCSFRNTSFNDFEDGYELESGSVFTKKVNLVLADPHYRICSARGQ